MYEFHYKYIKTKYNASSLLTDTDSLIYEIQTNGVYEDIHWDKNFFDFSDYSQIKRFLILSIKK